METLAPQCFPRQANEPPPLVAAQQPPSYRTGPARPELSPPSPSGFAAAAQGSPSSRSPRAPHVASARVPRRTSHTGAPPATEPSPMTTACRTPRLPSRPSAPSPALTSLLPLFLRAGATREVTRALAVPGSDGELPDPEESRQRDPFPPPSASPDRLPSPQAAASHGAAAQCLPLGRSGTGRSAPLTASPGSASLLVGPMRPAAQQPPRPSVPAQLPQPPHRLAWPMFRKRSEV